MKILKTFGFLLAIVPSWALASPPSVIGGKTLAAGTSAHVLGAGWPSLYYEWINGGQTQWGLGAEIVYGDWSGSHSDVDIGLGLNVPLKWHFGRRGPIDFAFGFKPGILMASTPGDQFVFGVRGEFGVPVSINLAPKVNLVTGVSLPMAVYFPENGNAGFVFPILPRIGVEVMPISKLTVWALVEMGPGLLISSPRNDVDFAIRGWFGVSFF